MAYKELAKLVPKAKRNAFAERLTDILLESGKGAAILKPWITVKSEFNLSNLAKEFSPIWDKTF